MFCPPATGPGPLPGGGHQGFNMNDVRREGSLEAPTRYPIAWKQEDFYQEDSLFAELERVYDICHGCRRCVSLCNAFPTLFDLIDNSDTFELDGVAKQDYWKVVDQCYLCDLCYLTKCPYVPPHPWEVDFPHLMLRAKAARFREQKAKIRDVLLSATDLVGNIAGIPVVAQVVNAANQNRGMRKLTEQVVGISARAALPKVHVNTVRRRLSDKLAYLPAQGPESVAPKREERHTRGRLALFVSCYANRYAPHLVEDMVMVLEHNGIQVCLVQQEKCCGMPKLELGDLEGVEKLKDFNIRGLARLAQDGWTLTSIVPSCVLMFRKELPLLFAGDQTVLQVANAFVDPFEYLMRWHRDGMMKTAFKHSLGRVVWHVPCHQRVQNIGLKTKEVLQLVPDTTVEVVERCSGHDGTYALKKEYHESAVKICRPVAARVSQSGADHFISDCPMAGSHIENCMEQKQDVRKAQNAFSLLRYAYGLTEVAAG